MKNLELYQHAGTGRFTWSDNYPNTRYYLYPTMTQSELPEMSQKEYSEWVFNSKVIDGVRVGPHVGEYTHPQDID